MINTDLTLQKLKHLLLTHKTLDLTCHHLNVCHVLLSLLWTSPFISPGMLFWWVLADLLEVVCFSYILHISSQRSGIFLTHVTCHIPDIFSWWCYMNYLCLCSYLVALYDLSCQNLFSWMFISIAFCVLFASILCPTEHLFTHNVTGCLHYGLLLFSCNHHFIIYSIYKLFFSLHIMLLIGTFLCFNS